MKHLTTILSFLFIFLFACNESDSTDEKENNTYTIEKIDVENQLTNQESGKLKIEGEDIWVRSEPINGDVVMKLNTGDECEILEISDEDQVRDMFDYWYKIKFNDKVGWVFGSQTNKKSGEIHHIKPFEDYFEEIALLYYDKTRDLQAFSHEELPYVFLYNPGAYCSPYSEEEYHRDLPVNIGHKNIYAGQPKGDFCAGYPGVKSGFYYWPIKLTDIPSYWDWEASEEGKAVNIEIPEKLSNNSFYVVQVITEEYHFAYMYFINIDLTWYLFCVNHCDCSA